MAVANETTAPTWRNFAVWSVIGAVLPIFVLWGAVWLLQEGASLRPPTPKTAAILGLSLVLAMAVVGFSARKRPVNRRTVRNFMIQNVAAIGLFLLVVWGFTTLAGTGAMTASVWAATATGATLIVISCFGSLAVAGVHLRADLVDDEDASEEMRDRARLLLLSFAWMIAWGLLLIGLALAGPAGLVSPAVALAGALALIAAVTVLGLAVWRLMDELDHTLSYESGNMACYLIVALGGGWAMLAHLGFAPAPAPLDWLTLLSQLMFAASLIVLGRRKLLQR